MAEYRDIVVYSGIYGGIRSYTVAYGIRRYMMVYDGIRPHMVAYSAYDSVRSTTGAYGDIWRQVAYGVYGGCGVIVVFVKLSKLV